VTVHETAEASTAPDPPAATGRRQWDWPALGALIGVTTVAVWLRLPLLTHLRLYTDDAWAAMPTRVGFGTALRMLVTAPGFYLAERTWIQLDPHSTVWAQLPALVLGLAAVLAVYVLIRVYRLPRWLGVTAALVVATGPVMVAYSTHVKEYSADFVLACALLALAEASRRSPESARLLRWLAVVSVAGFFISASTASVVAAVWCAVLIDGFADTRRRRRVLWAGGLSAGACAVIAAALLRHLPPSLHDFWLTRGFFPHGSSPIGMAADMRNVASSVLGGLGLWPGHMPPGALSNMATGPARTAVFLIAGFLMVAGLSCRRQALAPALVLLAAVLTWSIGLVPLGTGRTDVIVYPAILVLLALGARRVGTWLSDSPSIRPHRALPEGCRRPHAGYVVRRSSVQRPGIPGPLSSRRYGDAGAPDQY
jgi:hypothetical protein